MTTVYKQLADYDCHLCCIAMAVGTPPEKLFEKETHRQVDGGKGSNGIVEQIFKEAGLKEGADYWTVYVGSQNARANVLQLLNGRKAILQVPSLNNAPPAQHLVYWDGKELHDPSNKQVYRWLRQCVGVEHITIFAPSVGSAIGGVETADGGQPR